MLALLAPLLASGFGGFLGWLERRRLVKASFARNYYEWVNTLGERNAWSADLRKKVIEQRKRLEAIRAGNEVPKG